MRELVIKCDMCGEARCEIREKPMMNLYGAGGDRPEVLTPEEAEEVLKPEAKLLVKKWDDQIV